MLTVYGKQRPEQDKSMKETLLILGLFLSVCFAEIGFPAENPVANTQNKDERTPIYIPGRCPENQLLYPGDQPTDWVCDCEPSFVYVPKFDKCYEVYRQGYCKPGEYLILKKPEVVPECVRNSCKNDSMVPFQGNCRELYKTNGCPPLHLGGGTLGINATTLEIECMPGNAAELNIINVPNICPQGSKRSGNGQCRTPFSAS